MYHNKFALFSAKIIFYILPFIGMVEIYFGVKYSAIVFDALLLILFLLAFIVEGKISLNFNFLLVGFLIVLGVIEVFNPYTGDLVFKLKGLRLSAFCMLAFYLGFWAKFSERQASRFIKFNFIVFILVFGVAMQQLLFPLDVNFAYAESPGVGTTFYGDSYARGADLFRIYGPFASTTLLAAYSLWALSLTLIYFSLHRPRSISSLLLAIVSLVVVGMTYSRTAYVAAIVVILVCLYKANLGRINYKLLFKVVGIILLTVFSIWIASGLIPVFEERAGTLMNVGDVSSFNSRMEIWSNRISDILDAPFGYGTGVAGFQNVEKQLLVADNQFLKVFIEWGWLGGIAFLFLSVTWMLNAFERIDLTFPHRAMIFSAIDAYICGMLMMMFMGQILEGYPIGYMFWFLAGFRYQEVLKKYS